MSRKIGKALVVGAGISGIRSALDLAETGYGVTLIDRSPHMGGILSQLDYQFPSNRCGMCKMLPLMDRDMGVQVCLRKGLFHENIDILLSTELVAVEGEAGHFQVTLREQPRRIEPSLCIGCGECARVCPVEAPDEFNEGLSRRKAVYLPIPHALPNSYVIDPINCIECGECVVVCPTQAIRLGKGDRRKFRILVVDDELVVRDSLKEWLEDEEYYVDMAGSGMEALELLSRGDYHLMLADIKMPGMDGVELLRLAKESHPDLAVVMMTAYATVETAVESMKIGALNYLVKPFDPNAMIPMVLGIYQDVMAAGIRQLEVGAIVLSSGTSYHDPGAGRNYYGYGRFDEVVTSIELERMLSGSGPTAGKLVRPRDGKPVKKIAWLQCVGSRDLHENADFCSSICCMFAVKEALLAKEKTNGDVETAIFYMDMRTYNKGFQRYREQAEKEHGVRFVRARIHSLFPVGQQRDLELQWVDRNGQPQEEVFDLVVLSVGQRPSPGTTGLPDLAGVSLNEWGFAQTTTFSPTRTDREGILVSGSYSGLKDISESVLYAGSAALSASRVIHASGGGLAPEPEQTMPWRDVGREPPRVLIAVCTCGGELISRDRQDNLVSRLSWDTAVSQVVFPKSVCTADGWDMLAAEVERAKPNRVLIGACLPCIYARKLKELGRRTALDPGLMEVVDIRSPYNNGDPDRAYTEIASILLMGLAKVKWVDPKPVSTVEVTRRALVVGAGVAGMMAALAVADHGYPVHLVEKSTELGGNLSWLGTVLDGASPGDLAVDLQTRVEKHPLITVQAGARVAGSFGQVGHFYTAVENSDQTVENIEHGVVILATGGGEANTTSYAYGQSPRIVTQKELEIRLGGQDPDLSSLKTAVMIQCVDSREEPRNYCSRVCCPGSLKHALRIKAENPEAKVYILYRDMMTPGFMEHNFTRAREAGVLFIQYDVDRKPQVTPHEGGVEVKVLEPIVGEELTIHADLLVLATGIRPELPEDLVRAFGAEVDGDGFFREAESKWRPVDSLKEGVFACGLALAPRDITGSIATAEAAAQRALRILSVDRMVSAKVSAEVRPSLCSLCERCIDVCPYGARDMDPDREHIIVNPVMCQGCGSCAAVCHNGASILSGFQDQQMFEIIDAALEDTLW